LAAADPNDPVVKEILTSKNWDYYRDHEKLRKYLDDQGLVLGSEAESYIVRNKDTVATYVVRVFVPMTAKTKSRAKPERSHGRKPVGVTTKRTRSGEVRWIAQATINGAHFVLGTWATAEEAATAFDRAVLRYRGVQAPRNFPERDLLPASAKQLQEEAHRSSKEWQEIPYDGVSKVDGKHWTAKLRVDGMPRGLGTWPTSEAAAIAYDRAVLKYYGKTALRNFPERRLKPVDIEQLQAEARQKRGVRAKSGYLGVSPSQGGAWAATIGIEGKFERLGSWASVEEAAEAYDRAVLMYRGEKAIRNFPKRRLSPADAAQLRAEAHQAYKSRTSSKHYGVVLTIRGWSAMVGKHFLGTWQSEEKAAEARDRGMLFLGGPTEKLNFPTRRPAPASPSDLRLEARRDRKRSSNAYTSRYLGVCYNPANGSRPWMVTILGGRKQQTLGHWESETDAARTHDRAVNFYMPGKLPLNFPAEDNPPANAATLRAEAFREGRARYTSSFRGVHYEARNQCWRVTTVHQGSHIWLGRFANEREAALAFDDKDIELRGPEARLNFDPRTGKRVWGRRLRELTEASARKPHIGRPAT
jgi:hypothetical protein